MSPSFDQPDFSAGAWRGRKAPSVAVYDTQNGLIDDEGNLKRRGATSIYSTSDASATPQWLNVAYMPGPTANRVILASLTNIAALDGSLAPHTIVDAPTIGIGWTHWSRPTMLRDVFVAAIGPTRMFIYGGSLKSAGYSTGTVSTTENATTVVGIGTSWLANVDAGMIFAGGGGGYFVVKSVTDDTHLELTEPHSVTNSGIAYNLLFGGSAGFDGIIADLASRSYVAAASQRLLFATGNRVYFTQDAGFAINQYHEVPSNSLITGAEGMGDAALIFTTRGVWRISNLSFDAVDDAGNEQQIVEQVNKDVVLWDDYGVAQWDAGLVVPAIDDVYLMALDGSVRPISEGIRPLYRSYVDAGYQPGLASVYRGHYTLPILNGTTVVDTLVCRLDRPTQTPSGRVIYPWTRWEGHASGAAYAVLIEEVAREPKLLGISGERVTDITATLDGQGTTDADGTVIGWTATTNDIPLGFGTATDLRAWYELDATDAQTRLPWIADPWARGEGPIEADGNLITGPRLTATARSYLSTQPQVAPLAGPITIISRPSANAADNVFSVLGFVQDPVSGDGYEARLYYQLTADTVTIERYDNSGRTRVLSPVTLGARIQSGDTFELRVSSGGTLSVWINGSSVGSVSDTTYFHAGEAAHSVVGLSDTDVNGSSIRMRSDTLPAPTTTVVTVEYSSDADGGTWHALDPLDSLGEQNGGPGWATSDGSKYQWARVNKQRDKIRFRITLAGAAQSFTLRAISLLSRASGKQ